MGSEGAEGKPRFEPPPWEREAFEALAARRAEEQVAREALEAAERARAAVAPEDAWDEVPEAAKAEEGQATEGVDGELVAPAADPVPAPRVEDPQVEAMLLRLREEERTDGVAAIRVGQIAAALTMVLGAGMFIGGIVLLQGANGKMIAVVGSLILSMFGLVFAGMAVWVWISTNRSRGR
jgi:hypothetical protein